MNCWKTYAASSSLSSMAVVAEDAAAVDAEAKSDVSVPENAESFGFEAEVSRMLDIVVNSLYQNKDVFLRELISNASDALDKIRFLSLTDPAMLRDEEKLHVQIEYDKDLNTLTVRDTGIGMTHDELITNLGTVARSGTTKFLQALKAEGSADEKSGEISQIGQFGVGFYSAFLVSDRIQVASKHIDSPNQYVWTSTNGASEFNVYEDPRGNSLPRGTEITLFLKEDCLEYADEKKLSELAKHYSEFVTHPISLRKMTTMEVEVEDEEEEEEKTDDDLEIKDDEDEDVAEKPKATKEVTTFDWEVLNGNPAIWTRSKEDITDDEYQAFFKVLAKGQSHRAESWTHFNAEGNINFKSILYMPKDVPPRWEMGSMEKKAGLSLYVRKVLISDDFDLLPKYLWFMKGVVDSDDLPLNVNRETLQESKILQIIKKKLIRKALEMLKNFQKESDAEFKAALEEDEDKEDAPYRRNKYDIWYEDFSSQIKMGVLEDVPNRNKLMKLLKFPTTLSEGKSISLEQYVENMKDWQKEIFYVAGNDMDAVKSSQFLEQFDEKEVEVLYFLDPVDEYMVGQAVKFDDIKFKNVASDTVRLRDEDEDEDLMLRRNKFYEKKFKPLTKWWKKMLGTDITRVSVSSRQMSSPAIVSSIELGHSANMERIARAQAFSKGMTEFGMRSLKVLEINPRHPMILKLLESAPPKGADADFTVSKEAKNSAFVLYELALLNGGYLIENPTAHSKRVIALLQSRLGFESLELEPHPELPVEEDEAPDDEEDDDFDDFPEFPGLGNQYGNNINLDNAKDPEGLKDLLKGMKEGDKPKQDWKLVTPEPGKDEGLKNIIQDMKKENKPNVHTEL